MSMHLSVMAICAACVSIVFAVLHRDDAADQMKFAGKVFGGLLGGGLIIGALQNIFFH